MSVEDILFNESLEIVKKIAANKYNELVIEGKLKRLNVQNILDELAVYIGTIDLKTEEYRRSFEYIQIKDTNRFMTFLDLWFNGKRSDLTLICELELDDTGNIQSSVIEDLHVL